MAVWLDRFFKELFSTLFIKKNFNNCFCVKNDLKFSDIISAYISVSNIIFVMFLFSFVQVSHCLHEILDQCGAFSKLLMCCESPMIPRELGQLESIAKVSRNYISKKTFPVSQKFGIENIFQRRDSDLKGAIKPHSYSSFNLLHFHYSLFLNNHTLLNKHIIDTMI